MLRLLRALVRIGFFLFLVGIVCASAVIGIGYYRFSRDLPDHTQIASYVPATGTKVYAADGTLIAEFETERRIPVAIAQVPKLVIQAFLAAEDRDFYNHKGIDPAAIIRAGLTDVLRLQRGQRPMGASTITQQVVRHFLLTREVSVSRKIKEAILAYRIEHSLSKDRILEIYLNEIYFGVGAYGVAAAADNYFHKRLDQLTLAEAAFLAALPKAPNNYNPIRNTAAAKARRDWVIAGMAEMGWTTQAQARVATAEPLKVNLRGEPSREHVGYFVEEVRRELAARFGDNAVYRGGMTVRTSYTPAYQQMAEAAFRKGVIEYDRRHGWRGPVARLGNAAAAQGALATTAEPPGVGDANGGVNWQLAAVTATDSGGATIVLKSGVVGRIPLAELRWARRTTEDQRLGGAVRGPHDVVAAGDIVLVEAVAAAAPPLPAKGRHAAVPAASVTTYGLRQIPDIGGAVVAMDPQTGRVFALVGGWSYQQSQFNRATQAKRQPGSAFKPFVYVTALQNGFSPSSVIDDSPIEIDQGPGQQPWRPVNYEGGFVGPTTLADALIKSRNLVTARLATMIGLPAIAKTVQDLDVMDKMPLYYSMSLGAGETTLLRLTNAYAMLDNGGKWLLPSVIDLVQDRGGRAVYQKGVKGCAACFVAAGPRGTSDGGTLYRAAGMADPSSIYLPNVAYADNPVVYKPTKRDPLLNREAIAEVVAIMQGVVERGTGNAVAAVGKPLAGKTGTTSDWFDAWFVGFSPDLAAGVFVGFDEPRTLGEGETGGHVAAPIFRDFMAAALKDKPAKPFPVPASVTAAAMAANDARLAARGADIVNPDDPNAYTDAADDSEDDDPNARRGRKAKPSGARQEANAVPSWPGTSDAYGAPRPRNEAIRAPAYPAPAFPTPWGVPPYPSTGYGAGQPASPYGQPPARYGAPPLPYPPPVWGGVRPGYGTGGLY